jgi:hypothetical protein
MPLDLAAVPAAISSIRDDAKLSEVGTGEIKVEEVVAAPVVGVTAGVRNVEVQDSVVVLVSRIACSLVCMRCSVESTHSTAVLIICKTGSGHAGARCRA